MYFSNDYWAGFLDAFRGTGVAGEVTFGIFLVGLCYALMVQLVGMNFRRRLAMIPFSLLPFMVGCCCAALHFVHATAGFYDKFGESSPTEEQIRGGGWAVRGAMRAAGHVAIFGAVETIILLCFASLLLLGKHAGPRGGEG